MCGGILGEQVYKIQFCAAKHTKVVFPQRFIFRNFLCMKLSVDPIKRRPSKVVSPYKGLTCPTNYTGDLGLIPGLAICWKCESFWGKFYLLPAIPRARYGGIQKGQVETGELPDRQRPDITPVCRLFHYDVTIKWPVKWLLNYDISIERRQKVTWKTTCPAKLAKGQLSVFALFPVTRHNKELAEAKPWTSRSITHPSAFTTHMHVLKWREGITGRYIHRP